MLRRIWDYLFGRSLWKVVDKRKVYSRDYMEVPLYEIWVMQDQYGNVKQVKVGDL